MPDPIIAGSGSENNNFVSTNTGKTDLHMLQGHQKAITSVAFRDISKLEPEP
jgi:hypothetical protein